MVKDAVEFNGHYYLVFSVDGSPEGSWERAQQYCESRGGYLAVITSEKENNFLFNLIRNIKGYNSCYFGLTDKEKEGTWKWVDGEKVSYTNWEEGEPNNTNGGESYGMYYFETDTWNDEMPEIDNGVFVGEFEQ